MGLGDSADRRIMAVLTACRWLLRAPAVLGKITDALVGVFGALGEGEVPQQPEPQLDTILSTL